MSKQDYKPYSAEWVKEISKLTKATIVSVFANVGKQSVRQGDELLKLQNFCHEMIEANLPNGRGIEGWREQLAALIPARMHKEGWVTFRRFYCKGMTTIDVCTTDMANNPNNENKSGICLNAFATFYRFDNGLWINGREFDLNISDFLQENRTKLPASEIKLICYNA